jgi:hypothetical protein
MKKIGSRQYNYIGSKGGVMQVNPDITADNGYRNGY